MSNPTDAPPRIWLHQQPTLGGLIVTAEGYFPRGSKDLEGATEYVRADLAASVAPAGRSEAGLRAWAVESRDSALRIAREFGGRGKRDYEVRATCWQSLVDEIDRRATTPSPAPRPSPVTDEKDAEIEARRAPDKGEAIKRAVEKIEAEFAALFDEHGIGEVVPRISAIIEAELKGEGRNV